MFPSGGLAVVMSFFSKTALRGQRGRGTPRHTAARGGTGPTVGPETASRPQPRMAMRVLVDSSGSVFVMLLWYGRRIRGPCPLFFVQTSSRVH